MNWEVDESEKMFRVTGKIGTANNNNNGFQRINEMNNTHTQITGKIGNQFSYKLPQMTSTLLKIGHNMTLDTSSVA